MNNYFHTFFLIRQFSEDSNAQDSVSSFSSLSEGETSVTRSNNGRNQPKAGVPNFDNHHPDDGGIDVPDISPKTSITDPTSRGPHGDAGEDSISVPASNGGGGGVGRFNVKRVVGDHDQHSPREISTPTPSRGISPTPSAPSNNDSASSFSNNATSSSAGLEESQQWENKLERTKSPLGRFSVKPVVVAATTSTSTSVGDATISSSVTPTPNLSSSSKQVTSASTGTSTQQQQSHTMTPQSSFETTDFCSGGSSHPTSGRGSSSPRMTRWTSQDASTDTELDAKEEASSRSSSRLSKSKHAASSSSNTTVETIQDSPSGSPSLPRRRRQQEGKKSGPRVSSTVLEFDPLIVTSVLETLSSVAGASGSTTTNPVSSTGTQPTAEAFHANNSSGIMSSSKNSTPDNNSHDNPLNSTDNSYNTYTPSEAPSYPVAGSGLPTASVVAEGGGYGGSGTNSYCSSFNNSRCNSRTGSPTMNVTPSGSLENIKQYANNGFSQQSGGGAGSTSILSSLKRDDSVRTSLAGSRRSYLIDLFNFNSWLCTSHRERY